MSYKGVSKEEALDILTQRVREDLTKEGLGDLYFKAEGITDAGCMTGLVQSTRFPEGTATEQRNRFEEIVHKHFRDFFRQRYVEGAKRGDPSLTGVR